MTNDTRKQNFKGHNGIMKKGELVKENLMLNINSKLNLEETQSQTLLSLAAGRPLTSFFFVP